MSYAICRVAKVSSSSDVAGEQIHDRREREHSNSNPDIDFSRSNLNYCLCDSADGSSFNKFIDRQLKERYKGKRAIRKDAVRMVSVIFTSDKEFFSKLTPEQQRNYFQSCYEWAVKRWGANNIISAYVHMDEETPHMHLNFIPLTPDGRLSAKECIGNGSKALQKLQDDFYKSVGKPYGLERGRRANLDNGEKPRRHQSAAEYKASTNYYQQQKNALQADIQALQGQVNRFNEIIHAEPQNAIEGVPVPSVAKFAVGKENKDKLLYSPTDIEQVQELAKAVAVTAAANEQRNSELDRREEDISFSKDVTIAACEQLKREAIEERDKLLSEAEETSNRIIQQAKENASDREQAANDYYFSREAEIKKMREEAEKLSKQADYRINSVTEREQQLNQREKELTQNETSMQKQLQELTELTDRPDEYYNKIIEKMEDEFFTVNIQAESLQSTVAELNREVEHSQTEKAELQSRIDELIETHAAENQGFKQQLDALSKELHTEKEKSQGLTAKNDKLIDKYNEAVDLYNALNDKYKALYEVADYIKEHSRYSKLDIDELTDKRQTTEKSLYVLTGDNSRGMSR